MIEEEQRKDFVKRLSALANTRALIEEHFIEGTTVLHREDGPARVWSNGGEDWYLNGQKHREGGPAVTSGDGDRAWYRLGKHHREDGPAVERGDGYKVWFLNGEPHRTDGPAVEHPDGRREYWIEGVKVEQPPIREELKEVDFDS